MEDNSNSFTAQELGNTIAAMAIKIGRLTQFNQEFSEANKMLKKQLEKKEDQASDVTQTDTHDEQAEPEQPADLPTPE